MMRRATIITTAAVWALTWLQVSPAAAQRASDAQARGTTAAAGASGRSAATASVKLFPLESDGYKRVLEGTGCNVRPSFRYNGRELDLINRIVFLELCEAGAASEFALTSFECTTPRGARTRRTIELNNYERFDAKELVKVPSSSYVVILRDITRPETPAAYSTDFSLTGGCTP